MPDILIRMEMPRACADCPMCYDMMECSVSTLRFWHNRPENEQFDFCKERHPDCPLVELPPHGELIETKDVLLALVEHGQRDKRFKLGDTIRYSPSEVKEIIDASVPVIVPAERSGE